MKTNVELLDLYKNNAEIMIATIDDALLYFRTEKPKQPRGVDGWNKKEAYDFAIKALEEMKRNEYRRESRNN